jgi:ribosomal protein S18 acetylase RimI-like enzyme
MGPWEFRLATEADLPALLDLSIRVLRADLERVGRFDRDRRAKRMRASFDKGGLRLMVRDGTVLGCIQSIRQADHLEITSAYIEPSAQGSGLGRAAVAAILAEAPELEARIEVLKGSPARGFWERLGFAVTGEAGVDLHMSHPPRR